MNLQKDHMLIKGVNWVFQREDSESMSEAKYQQFGCGKPSNV